MAAFDEVLFGLKLFSALGCGLMAGVFFAFSTFVMNALARIQPAQGIAAMQSINVAVINPLFMLVFLGTALTCLVLAASAVLRWSQPGAGLLLAGALLYLLGTFLVTVAFNVPLNDALAKIDPAAPESARVWSDYVSRWTVWNHVRTAAALAAMAAFIYR
jgi:uncharacterized membrane protein